MTIYSTKRCLACNSLKAILIKKNIVFNNVFMEDILPHEQSKLKITSVPTIEFQGKRYRTLKEYNERN